MSAVLERLAKMEGWLDAAEVELEGAIARAEKAEAERDAAVERYKRAEQGKAKLILDRERVVAERDEYKARVLELEATLARAVYG